MNRYIRADLHRCMRRIPRYIVLVLIFACVGLIVRSVAKEATSTAYQIVDIVVRAAPYIAGIFGLVEYIYVYGDDFRAKTMQIAIGTGVRRRHVVLAKWLEYGFLCTLDLTVAFALIFGISSWYGLHFDSEAVRDMLIIFLFGLVKAFVLIGLTVTVVFRSQATAGGMLLYLALTLGVVKTVLSIVLDIKALQPLGLSDYLFSNLLDVAKSRAIVGTFSIPHILGIILYAMFGYFLTCRLFRKRELEF